MKRAVIAIICMVCLLCAGLVTPTKMVEAAGSIYYVGKNGSNSNNGSINSPWQTINYAAQKVTAGDTVNIETGTYNERIFPAHSGSAGNPITYQNYNGESVIIDGTGLSCSGLFLFQGTNYMNISGLTIENSLAAGDGNGIYLQGASNINIANCTITNTVASGIAAYDFSGKHCSNITATNCTIYGTNTGSDLEAISFRTVQTFTISNCIVHNTSTQIGIGIGVGCTNGLVYGNTVYNTGAMGIYIDSQGAAESNISIYNNVCYNNPQAGIGLSSENNGGQYPQTGISIYNNICYNNVMGFSVGSISVPSNTFSFNLINNTFYGNSYEAISLGTYSYIASAVIRNNISDGSNNAILMAMHGSGSNVTIDHNLFYSSGSYNSSNIYGTNYIQANPLLTNPTSNFALQSGSSAIGAGTATGASTVDYVGTARANPPCIGAYEYATASPVNNNPGPAPTTNGSLGYNSGTTAYSPSVGNIHFSTPGYTGVNATGISMSALVSNTDGANAHNVQLGIYTLSGSTYSLVAATGSISVPARTAGVWVTGNFTTSPSLSLSTTYYLGIKTDNLAVEFWYGTSPSAEVYGQSATFATWPTTFSTQYADFPGQIAVLVNY
jgi:parallel beta-helix repeat protein